jgi:hypothetical protein
VKKKTVCNTDVEDVHGVARVLGDTLGLGASGQDLRAVQETLSPRVFAGSADQVLSILALREPAQHHHHLYYRLRRCCHYPVVSALSSSVVVKIIIVVLVIIIISSSSSTTSSLSSVLRARCWLNLCII